MNLNLLLFLLASLFLLWAGLGVVLLTALRSRPLRACETLSLAFLCGAALVSLASFLLGWGLSGAALRWSVAALCLLTGLAGIIRWWRGAIEIRWSAPDGISDYLFLFLLLLQGGFLFWLSARSALLWDGLFNWEIKAQLAFQHAGRLPADYFTSAALRWSHPEYPLLLPLTEAWFFAWLGAAHQGMIKLLFPFFYLAALGLLAAGAAIAGRSGLRLWPLPTLLFFLPQLLFREGSVTSGYADFPLAVAYLAVVIYLTEYWQTDDAEALRLTGWLSAVLPWIKQEGTVLWLCVMALAALRAIPQRHWRELARAVLPGALIIVMWLTFIRLIKAPVGQDYLPFTLSTLRANLSRVPVILTALLSEFINWRHWSLLWPGLLLALPLLRRLRRQAIALGFAVILPLAFYVVVYLFISEEKNTVSGHIAASLPRLLTHVAPVALLLLWLALTAERDQKSELHRPLQVSPAADEPVL
ncbi:MAG TPA: hypothetical protein VNQ79_26515 [Blastocatellia bacterium]|nr:hypothetical protein [Blastocatellia bacterium]